MHLEELVRCDSEATIKGLRTDKAQADFYHDRTPRAGVRLTKGGRRSFFALYESPATGKTRRVWFGEHASGPLGCGPFLTVREFEDAYLIFRAELARGIDPVPLDSGRKRKTRTLPVSPASRWVPVEEIPAELRKLFPSGYGDSTLSHLFFRYFVEHASKELKPRTQSGYSQIWRTHLEPRFGEVPASKLTQEMVRSALSEIQKTSPQVVRSVKKVISVTYEWGREHFPGIVFNPAMGIKVTVSKGKRDRWLADNELGKLLPALDRLRDQESADCIRLILFSACRPGEAYSLQASDIETINGEKVWRMKDPKNGKEFMVPVQGKILEVISRRGKDLGPIFPSLTGKSYYPNRLKETMKQLRKLLGFSFKPHDLRRTCRTHLSILGILDSVAEAALNHAKEEIAATYNLYSFWRERKEALEIWHNKLSNLEAQKEEEFAA